MCVLPNLLCLPRHVYKCNLKLCSSRVWENSAEFPAVVNSHLSFSTVLLVQIYRYGQYPLYFQFALWVLLEWGSFSCPCCFSDSPSHVSAFSVMSLLVLMLFLGCPMFLVSFPDDSRFIVGHKSGNKSYPRLYGETYQFSHVIQNKYNQTSAVYNDKD